MSEAPDREDAWTELEALLFACLERPDAERAAALDELCAQHPQHAETLRQRFARLCELGFVGPTPPPPPQPGEVFGDYTLRRRLGAGAMGVVYLAQRTGTDDLVALKVLRPDLHEQPRARERFRRERIAAAKVDHPGICPVLHAGEVDGRAFLVMRYVPGGSLADAIARTAAAGLGTTAVALRDDLLVAGVAAGRARLLAAVALVEQVARALHAAHGHGLVHRDVKPGNILLGPDKNPVLVDFGLVRDDVADDPTLTVSTDPLGTPAYMAPEQIEPRGRRPDARTDVHALGAVLFECLTLHRPFEADSRQALYRAILTAEAPDARRWNADVGDALARVLQKALEKEPAHRYRSALEFAADLQRVRHGEPVQARGPGPWRRLRRAAREHPVLARAAVATFLCLATGLGVALAMLADVRQALGRRQAGAIAALSTHMLAHDTSAAMFFADAAVQQAPDDATTVSALYAAASELREVRCESLPSPYSLAAPADGRFAVVASDRTAQTWILRDERAPLEVPTQAEGHFHLHRVVVSADGARLLAMSVARWSPTTSQQIVGGLVTVWNPDAPTQPVARLVHPGEVLCGCFTADGSVLTGCSDGVARLWSPAGVMLHELRGHGLPVYSCVASPDGQMLVTGGHDCTVRRWDARSGQQLGEAIAHGGWVVAIDFAPAQAGRSDRFVTATGYDSRRTWRGDPGFVDDRARLFDRDGRLLAQLGKHEARIEGVRFSPDGRHVLTTGADYRAQLWRLADDDTAALVDVMPHNGVVYDAAFAANGECFATATFSGSVYLWDRAARPLGVLQGHRVCATGCVFVGERLVTSGLDGTVRTWSLQPRLVPTWSHGLLNAVAIAPAAQRFVVATNTGAIHVHERIRGGAPATTFECGIHNIACLAVEADGSRFLLGDEDGQLHLLGTRGEALRAPIQAHGDQIKQVQFRPGDPHHALSSSYDGRVCVWDLRRTDATPIVELVPAPSPPERAQWMPGRGADPVWSAAFSPDGRWIAAATDDPPHYRVQLWAVDAPASGPLSLGAPSVLGTHDSPVRSLAFAGNGQWLVCGTVQGELTLWNLRTGEARRLARLARDITAIAIASTGATIACGLMDGSVHVLHADGTPWYTLPSSQPGRSKGLHFLDHDERLLVASRSGQVTEWPVDPAILRAAWQQATKPRKFAPEQARLEALRQR